MWPRLRKVEEKRHLSFPSPWEFQTPSPIWEPQTSLSSLGIPDFLSTCLRTDSHSERWTPQVGRCLLCYWREGDDRGWDGWIASPTRWPWVWTSSKCWWWTRKPGMLQSMGGHKDSDKTERLKWTERVWLFK